MKNYEVTITDSEIYVVLVEADTENEAFEEALDRMEKEGKDNFHHDSDGDYQAYEV